MRAPQTSRLLMAAGHLDYLPKEAEVCLKFLEELTKVRSHNVQYRGESMASFNQRVFDELCKVDLRPPIT